MLFSGGEIVVSGSERFRDHDVELFSAGKAPCLRFSPREYVRINGRLYQIVYAFRTIDNPHVWMWCIEERVALPPAEVVVEDDAVAHEEGLIYEMFASEFDADLYYQPRFERLGNRRTLTTSEMLNTAEVVEELRRRT